MFREGQGERERSGFTWQQTQIIEGQKIMARSLAVEFSRSPDLTAEISDLVHNTPLTYVGVLRHYFFESGRDLLTVVRSPFIRAFEATPQCTEEESTFLAGLRNLTTSTRPIPDNVSRGFEEWVDTRVQFMARGFQRFVLYGRIIKPLTKDEIKSQEGDRNRAWVKAHPKEAAEYQAQAVQASRDSAHPLVYTDEVRTQMQAWFNRNYDYELVAELLRGQGIEVSPAGLKTVVHRYEDLHYTLEGTRELQRQAFRRAVKAIFEATRSRATTKAILDELGHHPIKTEAVLLSLGLRARIDWIKVQDTGGNTTALLDLMKNSINENHSKLQDEYQAFMRRLQENQIDVDVSISAYKRRRSMLLSHKPY